MRLMSKVAPSFMGEAVSSPARAACDNVNSPNKAAPAVAAKSRRVISSMALTFPIASRASNRWRAHPSNA
jgi:hypothetical protein